MMGNLLCGTWDHERAQGRRSAAVTTVEDLERSTESYRTSYTCGWRGGLVATLTYGRNMPGGAGWSEELADDNSSQLFDVQGAHPLAGRRKLWLELPGPDADPVTLPVITPCVARKMSTSIPGNAVSQTSDIRMPEASRCHHENINTTAGASTAWTMQGDDRYWSNGDADERQAVAGRHWCSRRKLDEKLIHEEIDKTA